MRNGWGSPSRSHRAATALVALTLLPVAVLVASARAGPTPVSVPLSSPALAAQDLDLPSVEALQRSQASNLFAPFSWNGAVASGPFVAFGFAPITGTIEGYSAVRAGVTEVLVQTIQIEGFSQTSAPQLVGPTIIASGLNVAMIAHEEPTALLEIETNAAPRNVVFTFPSSSTGLQVTSGTTWPRASLSFSIGDSVGRIIVGKGTITVNGTTATAALQSGDYLALRAVPSFADHLAERSAVIDAFASGRLVAEYDLVAMTNGGWLENSAEYRPTVTMISDQVSFNAAVISIGSLAPHDGLVLVAFDPRTMPVDSGHQLVVSSNGIPIPEAKDPLGALYAATVSGGQPSFSQLSMNATVLAIYLPNLAAVSLQVQSVALAPPGIDPTTEAAMIAAVFVVSVAAAVMFRGRHD